MFLLIYKILKNRRRHALRLLFSPALTCLLPHSAIIVREKQYDFLGIFYFYTKIIILNFYKNNDLNLITMFFLSYKNATHFIKNSNVILKTNQKF